MQTPQQRRANKSPLNLILALPLLLGLFLVQPLDLLHALGLLLDQSLKMTPHLPPDLVWSLPSYLLLTLVPKGLSML